MKNTKSVRLLSALLAVLLLVTFSGCNKKPDDDPVRGFGYSNTYNSSSWSHGNNTKKLDTSVAAGSRAKYTKIRGNGKDVFTIMIYMCGTDLESRSKMATYDITEMARATISDNINLLIYTGGCTQWHLGNGQVISTKVNQIYRILDGGQADRLVDNAGAATMVANNTLESFIDYCTENYEADRYGLIFWDHGSGSVGGYGYDEKYPNNGPMSPAKIDEALTNCGVKFDFVGFDACLMATLENALMLAPHADYMIASEEVEPGIGWYYTTWLTELSKNTSMSTLELGKNIIDSFVSQTAKDVPQQAATLSIIDLAELEKTVPAKLTAFADSANELLSSSQYRTVATARKNTREYGTSQGVDMVDFVDLASNINTDAGKQLTDALLSAVKYNNVSASMSDSYGISIYFPYSSTRYVNNVLKNYNELDMDASYTNVIRNFVNYQTSGQVSSGGSTNPFSSLTGSYQTDSYSSQGSVDLISSLLGAFLGGSLSGQSSSTGSYNPLYELGLNLLFGRDMDVKPLAEYVYENHFDADLTWKDGKIELTDKQWSLVDELVLNVFVDDGKGYIDLGCDDTYAIEGNALKAEGGDTWLALSCDEQNWTVVPYYYDSATYNEDGSEYTIYGKVPVLLNGEKAHLILCFTNDNPKGVVAGATFDYDQPVVAKNLTALNSGEDLPALKDGDVLQFICDYYDYKGNFIDAYPLNDPFTVNGTIHIGDIDISDYKVLATYQFTDIYHQTYWTTPIKK
ncbi:MAG: hypothetical protein K6A14_00045 [Erysipelotrichaceae bacterium]|nr:hypothetical protein [Erysipelotrichaceae bacterium]